MPLFRLPRTHGCLACGRDNPHGLHLRLDVDDDAGLVSTVATLAVHHVGFHDVIHGGLIATVADEAMVWAATWATKRFCLCGELTVRYRQPARPGVAYRFEAWAESVRPRLIKTTMRCLDPQGVVVATGAAKYVPVGPAEHDRVVATFIPDDESRAAARQLTHTPGANDAA